VGDCAWLERRVQALARDVQVRQALVLPADDVEAVLELSPVRLALQELVAQALVLAEQVLGEAAAAAHQLAQLLAVGLVLSCEEQRPRVSFGHHASVVEWLSRPRLRLCSLRSWRVTSATIASGMRSRGSTWSTAPRRIAARGMPNTTDDSSSCASVRP